MPELCGKVTVILEGQATTTDFDGDVQVFSIALMSTPDDVNAWLDENGKPHAVEVWGHATEVDSDLVDFLRWNR